LASAYLEMFIYDKIGKFKLDEYVAFIEILDLSELLFLTSKISQSQFIANKTNI